ncbi:hypothetical protein KC968_03730 [Candidatus Saccharibacteria bacterium]|nr:hypothetical protein [Candidatus Saccharibacteria bacterium]
MFPTEIFALRILGSLIPKSLRAGVMLALVIVFFSIGLHSLGTVLVGQVTAWTVIKCIVGLAVGCVSGCVFYYFQYVDGHPKDPGIEIVGQYYKDRRVEQAQSASKNSFDVVWTSDDDKPKDTEDFPSNNSQTK